MKRRKYSPVEKDFEVLATFTRTELSEISINDLYTLYPNHSYLYILTDADRKCGHTYDGCTCYEDHTTGFFVPDWDVEIRTKKAIS